MCFYNSVVASLEAGSHPVTIFLDLSKAFDCVNHAILLNKIFNYGIRGNAFEWIKSFLKDRKQYVSIYYRT